MGVRRRGKAMKLVLGFVAFTAWAGEPAPDINSVTCLKLNREIRGYIRRGVDLPLAELTLFRQTRNRLIEGFEYGLYSRDQLSTAMYELSRDVEKVVKTCRRIGSRPFVDMLPASVQKLLMATRGTSKSPAGR